MIYTRHANEKDTVIINSLIKNKTAQETAILYGAIILNILLGWVVAKLNTHYLTVEEYGQYGFFIAIIYYSLTFFTLGTFESTSRLLALQNNESERRKYIGASFVLSILFIIPFMIVIYLFSIFTDSLFAVKIGVLIKQNILIVCFVIIHSLFLIILRGSGQIKVLSLLTFSPRLFYLLLLSYLIIIDQFTLLKSIQSLLLGLIVSLILIIILVKPLFENIKQKIKVIIAETKQYGIHIYSGNIMSETLSHSDKFLISFFLSAESMAFYGLAYMLTVPLSHFSNSLATTLFSKFAKEKIINCKVLRFNFLFILVSVIIFILFREQIILHLFSQEYLPSVDIMLPLAMAFGLSGLCKPYTLFFMAKGYGKLVRNISFAIPVFNITLNLFLIPMYGINGAAWSAFAAYGLDFILYFFYYRISTKT